MRAQPRKARNGAKRPAQWSFVSLKTLRQRWFHRAGRLLRPQGRLKLMINPLGLMKPELDRLLRAAGRRAPSADENQGLRASAEASAHPASSGPNFCVSNIAWAYTIAIPYSKRILNPAVEVDFRCNNNLFCELAKT